MEDLRAAREAGEERAAREARERGSGGTSRCARSGGKKSGAERCARSGAMPGLSKLEFGLSVFTLLGFSEFVVRVTPRRRRVLQLFLHVLRVGLMYTAIGLGAAGVARSTTVGAIAVCAFGVWMYSVFSIWDSDTLAGHPTALSVLAIRVFPDLNFVFNVGIKETGGISLEHIAAVVVNLGVCVWIAYEAAVNSVLIDAWGCYPVDAKQNVPDAYDRGVCPRYSGNPRSPVCGWLGWEGSADASDRCDDPAPNDLRTRIWFPSLVLVSMYAMYCAQKLIVARALRH